MREKSLNTEGAVSSEPESLVSAVCSGPNPTAHEGAHLHFCIQNLLLEYFYKFIQSYNLAQPSFNKHVCVDAMQAVHEGHTFKGQTLCGLS